MSGLKPFEPEGAEPMWQMIYTSFAGLKIGDLLTKQMVADALGDPRWQPRHETPMRKAMRLWEADHKRAFSNRRGVGWEVAHPAQHEHLSRRKTRRAQREQSRAVAYIENADRSLMASELRDRFNALELNQQHLLQFMKVQSRKNAVYEEVIADLPVRYADRADTDRRLAALDALIEQHFGAGSDPA